MDTRVDDLTRISKLIDETAGRAETADQSRFIRQFFEDVPPADLTGVGAEAAWAPGGGFLGLRRRAQGGRTQDPAAQPRRPARPGRRHRQPHGHRHHQRRHAVPGRFSQSRKSGARHDSDGSPGDPSDHVQRDSRNGEGRLQSIFGRLTKTMATCTIRPKAVDPVILIQISEADRRRLAEIAAGVEAVLDDVRAAVEDWQADARRASRKSSRAYDRPAAAGAAESEDLAEALSSSSSGSPTTISPSSATAS